MVFNKPCKIYSREVGNLRKEYSIRYRSVTVMLESNIAAMMFGTMWSNKKHSWNSMTWHRLHLHRGWIGVYKNRSSGRGWVRGRGCWILLTGSTGWPLQSIRGHSPKPLWTYFRCCGRQSEELEKLIERINMSNSFNHRCHLLTDEVIMTSQKSSQEWRLSRKTPL